MKFKLINIDTNEETICEKIVIDGFDYYVSDEIINDVRPFMGRWQIEKGYILNKFPTYLTDLSECRLVIATNNSNIDLPQVVDEADVLADKWVFETNGEKWSNNNGSAGDNYGSFKAGYKKSQETHPNSDQDMIDFYKWLNKNLWEDFNDIKKGLFVNSFGVQKQEKELIQLWKDQQPRKIYYQHN